MKLFTGKGKDKDRDFSLPGKWYRLDNAAKIYPVIMKSRHISLFRLAAVLESEIDPEILTRALRKTLERVPYFAVSLKKGVFWYYLETCRKPVRVEPDVMDPMRPWSAREAKGYLFRVRYYQKRIAVEYFHALTDGYGGLVFLKTLIAFYLELLGVPYTSGSGVLDKDSRYAQEEMEDAYRRYSNFCAIKRPREKKAFHLQGTINPGHQMKIITGTASVTKVAEVARQYKVSVTEFLVGVYMYQLYQIQQKGGYNSQAPVRVSVPVNVRRFYPTKTLRNFALYANPGIEPAYGIYTFEEVLGLVHHFMRYTVNEKYLNAMMCANVSPENNIFLRISPLFLKKMAMRLVYSVVGESQFTSTVSNLGAQQMPSIYEPYINRFEIFLGPSRFNPVNCAVISHGDKLTVNFSSTMEETDPQRAFFQHLVRLKIPVLIESNQVFEE